MHICVCVCVCMYAICIYVCMYVRVISFATLVVFKNKLE